MKKSYEVAADGEVARRWRVAGERVEMTEMEAKYLAPPLGSILIPVEDVRKAGNGKFDRHQRRRRDRSD